MPLVRHIIAGLLLAWPLAAAPAIAQTPPERARDAAWSVCRKVIGGAMPPAIQAGLGSEGFSLRSVPGFRFGYGWSDGPHVVTIGFAFAGGLRESGECVVTLTGPNYGEAATRAAVQALAEAAQASETAASGHLFMAEWEEAYEVITLDSQPEGGWRFRIGAPAGGWREGAGQ